MATPHFNHIRLLRITGLIVYLCCCLPLFTMWATQRMDVLHRAYLDYLRLALVYLLFGVLYVLVTNNLGSRVNVVPRICGLLLMTAAALVVGWLSHSGLSALLLVAVGVVLPWLVPFWVNVAWIGLQWVCLTVLFSTFPDFHHSLVLGAIQSSIYIAFSMLGFITSLVASQQNEEREAQRRLNSELRATRALLAESTRIAERMRIARELHDLIGHHLTALSLNLEVASHLSSEPAAGHVRKAQSTARLLLADVREAVSELRQDDAIDLTQALQSLVEGVPSLQVHLDIPPRFSVEDPRRAQVLLRCAQEIITNTARHAGARNLWLSFAYDGDTVLRLQARDDGRGSSAVLPGNGLSGMRERVAEFGGDLLIESRAGQGFSLSIRLPLGEPSVLAHTPSRLEPPALSLG